MFKSIVTDSIANFTEFKRRWMYMKWLAKSISMSIENNKKRGRKKTKCRRQIGKCQGKPPPDVFLCNESLAGAQGD